MGTYTKHILLQVELEIEYDDGEDGIQPVLCRSAQAELPGQDTTSLQPSTGLMIMSDLSRGITRYISNPPNKHRIPHLQAEKALDTLRVYLRMVR